MQDHDSIMGITEDTVAAIMTTDGAQWRCPAAVIDAN
jgi:hypothetical protein